MMCFKAFVGKSVLLVTKEKEVEIAERRLKLTNFMFMVFGHNLLGFIASSDLTCSERS